MADQLGGLALVTLVLLPVWWLLGGRNPYTRLMRQAELVALLVMTLVVTSLWMRACYLFAFIANAYMDRDVLLTSEKIDR